MAHLIDKNALVAEIERRRQTWQHQDQQYVNGGRDVCDYLLGFLDTLELKEPVSEELEEAAEDYAVTDEVLPNGKVMINFQVEKAFMAGAKWMKKQMMAKAIDGDITFDYYGVDDKTYGCIAHDSFCLEDFGLKDRDKVKVIVIKED